MRVSPAKQAVEQLAHGASQCAYEGGRDHGDGAQDAHGPVGGRGVGPGGASSGVYCPPSSPPGIAHGRAPVAPGNMVAFAYRDVPPARFRAARTSCIVALPPAAEGSDVAGRFLARASGIALLDAARHGVVGGGMTSAFVAGCSPAAFGGAAVRHGTMPAAPDGSAGLVFGLTLSRGGRPHRLLFVRGGRMLVWRAIGG